MISYKLICYTVAYCGDPGSVDNAVRFGTDFTEGSSVSYNCISACHRGGGSITCNANGSWDPKPTCDGKCALRLEIIDSICFIESLIKKQNKSHSRSLDLHLVFIIYANEDLPE